MTALLRQSIYSRLAGYEDTKDAERLAVDPTMRQVVGDRARDRDAALTSQMGRFETEVLTQPGNSAVLMHLSGRWIDAVHERKPIREIVLDLDSSVSETYGQQEGSAYNGHFACTCYHPLFCFNQDGELERALLRNGNVHSADDWRSVLEPVVARYRPMKVKKFFRGDATFANPELYPFLEAEGYLYAIRLPANDVLQREIEHLLTRPVGRPPGKPIVWYHGFMYEAASWDKPRRVVAKVEWHQGELFPRVGFIVTNLGGGAASVVWFYNGRGTAEQWIKEGKNAVKKRFPILVFEAAASAEEPFAELQPWVSYAKLPTAFVGQGSYGKFRIECQHRPITFNEGEGICRASARGPPFSSSFWSPIARTPPPAPQRSP